MFMEAEPSNPPEVYKNAAGFAPPIVTTTISAGGRTYVNLDSKNWQGGTTTVVTPSSAAPLFADLQSHTMIEERKVNRGGGRKSATLKEEDLCPEEEERRRVRRERNKLAAARCRKRRMDQTEILQEQVDSWEENKKLLQEEIQSLQAQREELQFSLDAHNTVCKRNKFKTNESHPFQSKDDSYLTGPQVVVKTEPLPEETVYHLSQEETLEEISNSTTFPDTAINYVLDKPHRPQFLGLNLAKDS